jgi:hypothetical protein
MPLPLFSSSFSLNVDYVIIKYYHPILVSSCLIHVRLKQKKLFWSSQSFDENFEDTSITNKQWQCRNIDY